MGRRYYCDYCEKSFADNATNRRNHLKGVQHRSMRQLHYDSFQDPEILLADDANKNPCRQFLQTGECKFSSSCKYSHLRTEDRERLKAIVAAQQKSSKRKHETTMNSSEDGKQLLSDWMSKRSRCSALSAPAAEISSKPPVVEDPDKELICASGEGYLLSSVLQGIPNLPISLLPPDLNSLQDVDLVQWG